LEDVALAARVKARGYRIWFGSGKGIVCVRMYRSFAAMWEGWRKNLYALMGGNADSVKAEVRQALLPMALSLLTTIGMWGMTKSTVFAAAVLANGLLWILIADVFRIRWNGFPARLAVYGIPGRVLFAALLWASYRSHRSGRLEWKGRAYPVGTPRASKG
jgi:hypothetical protein